MDLDKIIHVLSRLSPYMTKPNAEVISAYIVSTASVLIVCIIVGGFLVWRLGGALERIAYDLAGLLAIAAKRLCRSHRRHRANAKGSNNA